MAYGLCVYPKLNILPTCSLSKYLKTFSEQIKRFIKRKVLDSSKLKAFADKKIDLNEISKLILGRVENVVGKGENAVHQHFLLFRQNFQKPPLFESLKVRIVR